MFTSSAAENNGDSGVTDVTDVTDSAGRYLDQASANCARVLTSRHLTIDALQIRLDVVPTQPLGQSPCVDRFTTANDSPGRLFHPLQVSQNPIGRETFDVPRVKHGSDVAQE
jgi:hypothetical protein